MWLDQTNGLITLDSSEYLTFLCPLLRFDYHLNIEIKPGLQMPDKNLTILYGPKRMPICETGFWTFWKKYEKKQNIFTTVMSPVSLVFHTIVTWDWSQKCYWNKDTCSILLDIHISTVNFITRNSDHPNKQTLTLATLLLCLEHKWFKTVYQTKIPEPYPKSNGRQK